MEPSVNGNILIGSNRGKYSVTGACWGVGDSGKSRVFGCGRREQGPQKWCKARWEARKLRGENEVQRSLEGYVIRKWGSHTIAIVRGVSDASRRDGLSETCTKPSANSGISGVCARRMHSQMCSGRREHDLKKSRIFSWVTSGRVPRKSHMTEREIWIMGRNHIP